MPVSVTLAARSAGTSPSGQGVTQRVRDAHRCLPARRRQLPQVPGRPAATRSGLTGWSWLLVDIVPPYIRMITRIYGDCKAGVRAVSSVDGPASRRDPVSALHPGRDRTARGLPDGRALALSLRPGVSRRDTAVGDRRLLRRRLRSHVLDYPA